MAEQLRIEAFAEFFRAKKPKKPWNPLPHRMAQVKSYLMGYHANRRPIKARIQYMADKLGIGRSTLCRYLRRLAQDGWIETVKRTTRAALRQVLVSIGVTVSGETPSETCIEVKAPSTKVLERREMFTPLVVFLSPVRRFASSFRKKNPPKRTAMDELMDRYRREEAEGIA